MQQHIKTGILDRLELLQVQSSEHEFPLHYHESFCLSLIQSGSIGENNIIGSAGSVMISHPFEVHENNLVYGGRYSMTTLYVSSDLLYGLASAKHLSFSEKVIDNPEVYRGLQQFADTFLEGGMYQQQKSVEQSFINTLRLLLNQHSIPQPFLPEKDETERLNHVRQFILHHLSGKIALQRLAVIAGMDKYQMIRWFKKQVGLTPFQFITLQRIEAGKKMIREGKPLVYAALDSGFYDQSHFSNYFKQFVGLTPGEYQQQCNILQDQQL